MNTPLVELNDVSVTYDGNPILEHVSFSVAAGDYVGIVGPNGGGKTTLLKVIVGLVAPQSGTVKIDGVPLVSFTRRFEIGYVPQRVSQDSASFPATVEEVVGSGRLARHGIFHRLNAEDRVEIGRAMEVARVADLRHTLMSKLSGGQRQRVYVARALAGRPRILVLDEPFVGVDVASQSEFYAFLKELNTQEELTILFVSHDIDVISDEVKSIVCLNRGLMCLGDPSILHEPHVIEKVYGRHITHLHRPHSH